MIAIGLISGTSADGVDVAVCEITGAPPATHLKLLRYILLRFGIEFLCACSLEHVRVDELCRLSTQIGYVFAGAVNRAVGETNLPLDAVDLIGSYRQTF
jgi:anhydro-N-acetylmuramic acid kinase